MDLTTDEFVLVAFSPVVVYAMIKVPTMRKLGWAGLMLFLSLWAMYDAIKIVRS